MAEETDDKIRKLYSDIQGSKTLGPTYKDVTYEQFRPMLLDNEGYRKVLHSELTDNGIIAPDRSYEDFDKRVKEYGSPATKILLPTNRPAALPPNPTTDAQELIQTGAVKNPYQPTLLDKFKDSWGGAKPIVDLARTGVNAVKGMFAGEPEKDVPFVQPKQWQNQAEIEQSALSPVFKDNQAALDAQGANKYAPNSQSNTPTRVENPQGSSVETPVWGNEQMSTSGMKAMGNIDLKNRPIHRNPDGSISTVKSMSFGTDEGEVLLPTISDDGRELTPEEAFQQYRKTGKHLGIFDTPENATKYAEDLHNSQDAMYGSKKGVGLIMPTKDTEQLRRLTPEQKQQAIEGSTGAPLAEEHRRDELGVGGRLMEDAGSVAGAVNRSILKAPSSILKTADRVANALGVDRLALEPEETSLYDIADTYDKWLDESEIANKYIGDAKRQGLAVDAGSGIGQILTMIAAGPGGVARAAIKSPTLWKEVAKKAFSPASGVAFSQVFSLEYDGMKQKGESDDVAFKQALSNAMAAMPLEALPLTNLAERLAKVANPTLAVKLLNTLSQGVDEASQEGIQQIFSNLSNNALVELNKNLVDWSEGLPQSSKAGGIVGLIIGAAANALHGKRKPPTHLGGIKTEPAPNGPDTNPVDVPDMGNEGSETSTQTDEEVAGGAVETQTNTGTDTGGGETVTKSDLNQAISDESLTPESGQVGDVEMQEVTTTPFQPFIDIINESQSLDEAIGKVREINNVPPEVSAAFREQYGKDGESPEQAFENLYNEVKNTEQSPVIADNAQTPPVLPLSNPQDQGLPAEGVDAEVGGLQTGTEGRPEVSSEIGGDEVENREGAENVGEDVKGEDGDVTEAERMQFGAGYKDYDFKKENIPTSKIKITEQPSLSERKDLVEDIKANGIKEPIVVEYDKESDTYYVKNGNNRAAIAKELGITEVPTIIAEYKEQSKAEPPPSASKEKAKAERKGETASPIFTRPTNAKGEKSDFPPQNRLIFKQGGVIKPKEQAIVGLSPELKKKYSENKESDFSKAVRKIAHDAVPQGESTNQFNKNQGDIDSPAKYVDLRDMSEQQIIDYANQQTNESTETISETTGTDISTESGTSSESNETAAVDSPFTTLDAALELKGPKATEARNALKEIHGKEKFKKMVEITRNFDKIIADLEQEGKVKKDCP